MKVFEVKGGKVSFGVELTKIVAQGKEGRVLTCLTVGTINVMVAGEDYSQSAINWRKKLSSSLKVESQSGRPKGQEKELRLTTA